MKQDDLSYKLNSFIQHFEIFYLTFLFFSSFLFIKKKSFYIHKHFKVCIFLLIE